MQVLRNKNILLISPERWDHIFVSKHHYAVTLAKAGNNIYFLNPSSVESKVESTKYEHLWSVYYKGFPKGIRFYPAFLQRFFTRNQFNRLQLLCNTTFDIVWSFDNSVFYNFESLPEKAYCISHIVDLNQDFQTAKAAKSADLCIGVIPKIVERLKKFNTNTHLITHGVQEFPDNLEPVELPGQNGIKALYAGNLMMPHIDWQILHTIANNHPEVDFVFIGPNWKQCENNFKLQLQQLSNVYVLNAVPAEQLPSYLKSASILLLAYTPEYSKRYASPHKMMEYLMAGKMIVATKMTEYSDLAMAIAITNENHEFSNLFNIVLSDLDAWNSDAKKQDRINFALENTYCKQLERIERILPSLQG